MKKRLRYSSMILVAAASAAMLGGCNFYDDIFSPDVAVATVDQNEMSPSASLFVWGGYDLASGVTTRALVDQITTRTLDSNFLRIDENIGAGNVGTYTFNQWNQATVLEATVISSPDNTPNIYYRAVTFSPTQTYSIFKENENDTTFYHTRLVGWYPRNCSLPLNEKGKPVATPFDRSRFNSQRVDLGSGNWGVKFDRVLDGKTDLMMSNLKEGQQWHTPFAGEVAYAQPFGHNEMYPTYSNYLTYKHYLSVVRIWAYADPGTQNLQTWGRIEGLTFINQPTTCIVALPNELNAFGEVESDSWTDFQNLPAVTSLMYGSEDINHRNDDYEATYPINMSGHLSSLEKTYLGYCLVRPESEVEISLLTSAGTFNAILPRSITDNETGTTTELFEASKIYDFTLNLKTSGTMEIYIQNEDVDNFTNLSPWNTTKGEYETANSYIIDTDSLDFSGEEYPGFCFCGNIIGNGEGGLMTKGSTTFHTSDIEISDLNSVELVWESTRGLISNLQLQHGYIRFQLPGELVSGVRQAVEGNAVIAVKDEDDNILWSWHIWITDHVQDITYTLGSSTLTIMDRNLGATAASFTGTGDMRNTYGLYYQWGRKDPSPGPSTYNYSTQDMSIFPVYNSNNTLVNDILPVVGNNTLVTAIEHPMELLYATGSSFYAYDWLTSNIDFLWGDGGTNKTIYDPCPYGYRVPAEDIANLFALNPTYTPVTSDGCGGLNVTYGGVTSFFPCAGYKGPDRGMPEQSGGWRYVGTKGDYMGSFINDVTGIFKNHRTRSYIAVNDAGWDELSVPGGTGGSYHYDGYVTNDQTNRKTSASVRCVKMQ